MDLDYPKEGHFRLTRRGNGCSDHHRPEQAKRKDAGIKVLSLFFIDRVDNYALKEGIIRRLFSQLFNELKAKYPEWKAADPEAAQAAYFAQKRRKGGVAVTS